MDTITHGITGALIGKGFVSEKHGRIATFALTLGAVFPDADVVAEIVSGDPMALLKYHRGITHSFVGLPFFAAGLAGLTRWVARRRGMECPSWSGLWLIYAIGIASHIVLDGLTSFGTRIWDPLSFSRAAWDWIFIVDFVFTSIVLLPQVVAWIYRKPEGARPALSEPSISVFSLVGPFFRAAATSRALRMWVLFTLCAVGVFELARMAAAPFGEPVVVTASVVFATIFFLPSWRGWGFRVRRAGWCQAGTWIAVAYLVACGVAHHVAFEPVAKFAGDHKIAVENLAAIPAPPSILNWYGMARTSDGVYQARFSLTDREPPRFEFVADSNWNRYIAAACELPAVKTYLGFARFPIVRYHQEGNENVVELNDARFFGRSLRNPKPFTYRVVLDADGNVIDQDWVRELTVKRTGNKE